MVVKSLPVVVGLTRRNALCVDGDTFRAMDEMFHADHVTDRVVRE
jgi:hypothetical protein